MIALLLRARAVHLALLRVSVVLVTLVSPEPELARGVARAPSALRFFPEGLRLAATWLPVSPAAVEVSRAAYYSAGALALVGLFTRPALFVFGLAALHLFALCQLTGEVVHDMHLAWLLVLLAASPAGDALSVDARLARRRRSRRRDPAYELTLGFARALLGVVYFFPGFWKLATSGLAWITSDNVRNQMHWKWAQWGGALPPVRVDLVPGLVEVGAACVVAFELGFFFLALAPRARRPLALGGLVFHQLTEVFFHIRFVSLYACYTCLVADGGRRGVRGRQGGAKEPVYPRRLLRADRRGAGPRVHRAQPDQPLHEAQRQAGAASREGDVHLPGRGGADGLSLHAPAGILRAGGRPGLHDRRHPAAARRHP